MLSGLPSTPQFQRAMTSCGRDVMHDDLNDLLHSGHSNTFLLLDSQWVIRRFEFDYRPLPYGARIDVGLEVQRLRVAGQRCAKPSKVRELALAPRSLPQFAHPLETLFT